MAEILKKEEMMIRRVKSAKEGVGFNLSGDRWRSVRYREGWGQEPVPQAESWLSPPVSREGLRELPWLGSRGQTCSLDPTGWHQCPGPSCQRPGPLH